MKRMSIAAIWPALVLCGSLALASAQSGAQTGVDAVEWEKVQNSAAPDAYVSFLEQFPGSEFSAKARAWLQKYLRELHVDAFSFLDGEDKAKSMAQAKDIYEEILQIDPNNAMALNNMAFILSTEFAKLQAIDSPSVLSRKEQHRKELVRLLKQAQQNANRRKVARVGLVKVFAGRERAYLLVAVKPPEMNRRSASLRVAVSKNLKELSNELGITYEDPPEVGDLHVVGTVVDRVGNLVRNQKLLLIEVRPSKGEIDSEPEGMELAFVMPIDKNNKVIDVTTETDERGAFTFTLKEDSVLDPFADKTLLIMERRKGNPPKDLPLLTKNGRLVLFQADLDENEMRLGQIVLQQ